MGGGRVIRGARVVDGSGVPAAVSAVAMVDGRIAALGGADLPTTGMEVVEAGGLTLAPGFIDSHTHSDISILADPVAEGKLAQGVTTDIVGMCGLSVFPVSDLNRAHLREIYQNYGVDISWSDLAGYAAAVDHRRPGINIASLCGHNTLRAATLGYGKKSADAAAIAEMRRLLAASLRHGAAGLSTGLVYTPGKFAEGRELRALLDELAPSGKPYATHLRNEGDTLVEALEEAIELCRQTAAPKLHISHLKTARERNWHKLDRVLELVETAAARGAMRITADRYPYIEGMTQLSIIAPAPYDELDDVALRDKLAAPAEFAEFLAAVAAMSSDIWPGVRLVDTGLEEFRAFRGQPFPAITAAVGLPPWRIYGEIIRADAPRAVAAFAGMSADNMRRIISQPWVCCGSDESARPPDYSLGRGHPRGFGSFPRFLRQVRGEGGIDEAARRLAALPAMVFNLPGRGRVAPGFVADLVLFDPDKFKERSSFADPNLPANGVAKVWIGGELAFADGQACKRRHGHFLKNP